MEKHVLSNQRTARSKLNQIIYGKIGWHLQNWTLCKGKLITILKIFWEEVKAGLAGFHAGPFFLVELRKRGPRRTRRKTTLVRGERSHNFPSFPSCSIRRGVLNSISQPTFCQIFQSLSQSFCYISIDPNPISKVTGK